MTRKALFAASFALVCGAAGAGPAGGGQVDTAVGSIGADPWVGIAPSLVFNADDAYVFADVTQTFRLDADATAVAIRIDLERLAQPAAEPAVSVAEGRVDGAFAGFAPVGPEGVAYASLGFARSGSATNVQMARTPASPSSLVAMATLPR